MSGRKRVLQQPKNLFAFGITKAPKVGKYTELKTDSYVVTTFQVYSRL